MCSKRPTEREMQQLAHKSVILESRKLAACRVLPKRQKCLRSGLGFSLRTSDTHHTTHPSRLKVGLMERHSPKPSTSCTTMCACPHRKCLRDLFAAHRLMLVVRQEKIRHVLHRSKEKPGAPSSKVSSCRSRTGMAHIFLDKGYI
jgi:hypothetical protein